MFLFFFKQKTAYEMRISDWSSDVCSSDLTIATNMAGRGTDIQLGGNLDMWIADEAGAIEDEAARAAAIERITAEHARYKQLVLDAGGLYVVGTERHESRRIDNQLRGRSGRQGDPGRSKFFLRSEEPPSELQSLLRHSSA